MIKIDVLNIKFASPSFPFCGRDLYLILSAVPITEILGTIGLF
jgi:hypothetical protein